MGGIEYVSSEYLWCHSQQYTRNSSLTYYHSTTVCIAGMHGGISRDLPSLYVTIIGRVERVLQCFYCTMEHVTPMLSVGGCV